MNTSATSMGISLETSPLPSCLAGSSSDGEHDTRSPVSVGSGENERPERMRDWLIRMINSGRFIGLEWLDKEKTVFKVPWIHAKKRGYCRERDAALFREWAIHSGKYRQDSDPTVWKINFRCAINGLKDIQEIKDMQTEDCRVYKVYPSRSRRRRRTVKRTEPYPTSCSSSAYTDMSSQHLYSNYSCSYGMPPTSTDPSYSSYSSVPPNVKLEYPSPICGGTTMPSHLYGSSMPTTNGLYPSTRQVQTSSGVMVKSNPYYEHVTPVQIPSTKNCTALSRVDSPDSGINVEVQNSPSGMIQQSSPLQQQQHSPPLHQRHSSPTHQQQSPPTHSPPAHQQHSPSPPSQAQQHSSLEQKPFVHSLPNCSSMGVSSPLNTCCHSPSMTGSPAQSILSEEDDDAVSRILDDLEDNPPTPISPHVPSGKLLINVYYGTLSVLSEEVDCSAGKCRIVSSNSPPIPPGYPSMHTIVLPDSHPQSLSRDIFAAMENGVVLEVNNGDVYVTPQCRTMIYCSSSPSPSQKAQSIIRDYPTLVFSYNHHFRPALEHYALIQGQSPSPQFFLGLGQSWGCGQHVSQNLITITVTHCKAKNDIDTIGLPQLVAQELLIEIPDSVEVNSPTNNDLQAEAFLQNLEKISN